MKFQYLENRYVNGRLVTRHTKAVDVDCCYRCPFSEKCGNETNCSLMDTSKDAYANLVPPWSIPSNCPIKGYTDE